MQLVVSTVNIRGNQKQLLFIPTRYPIRLGHDLLEHKNLITSLIPKPLQMEFMECFCAVLLLFSHLYLFIFFTGAPSHKV